MTIYERKKEAMNRELKKLEEIKGMLDFIETHVLYSGDGDEEPWVNFELGYYLGYRPTLYINVVRGDREFIDNMIFWVLRQKYGCTFDMHKDEYMGSIVYTSDMEHVLLRIRHEDMADCKIVPIRKERTYEDTKYEIQCNGGV